MARIYQSQNQQQGFQGSARSVGYQPVQGLDSTKRIQQETRDALTNLEYQARAASRDEKLAQEHLRQEGVRQDAALKIAQAESTGKFKMMEGLLSLSKTAVEGAQLWYDYKEKRQEEDDALSFLTGGAAGVTILPSGDVDASNLPESDQQAAAVSGAAPTVAANDEKAITSVTKDPVVQEGARRPVADANAARGAGTQSANTVIIGLPGYLATFMTSDVKIRMSDGRIITPQTARPEDLPLIQQAAIADWAKKNGVSGMDRGDLVRVVLPGVKSALAANTATFLPNMIKGQQMARADQAEATAVTSLQAGTPLATVFDRLSKDNLATGLYGGNQAAANQATVDQLIEYFVSQGDYNSIRQLGQIQKIPGQKGTELYTNYSKEIEDGIRRARQTNITREQQTRAESSIVRSDLENTFLTSLLDPNATPESRATAQETLVAGLRALGDTESLRRAVEIESRGTNYNPLNAQQLQEEAAESGPISQDRLNDLLDKGYINGQEYKALGGLGVNPDGSAKKPFTKQETELNQVLATGIVGEVVRQKPGVRVSDSISKAIAIDIESRLSAHMQTWKQDNPNATQADYQKEATSFVQSIKGELQGKDFSTYEPQAGRTYRRGDHSSWSPQQITAVQNDKNKQNDIDPTKSYVLSVEETKEGMGEYIKGSGAVYSERIVQVADALGLTPEQLLERQGRLRFGGRDYQRMVDARRRSIESDKAPVSEENAPSVYESVGISPVASERVASVLGARSPADALAAVNHIRRSDPQGFAVLTNPNSSKREIDHVLRGAQTTLQASPVGPRTAQGTLTYRGNEDHYVSAGQALQSVGFKVAENPDFGGVAPVHSAHGYHPHGEAFDVTHWNGTYNESIAKTQRLKSTIRGLRPPLFREIIGPGDGDPNHSSHLHLGGLLRPITPADVAKIRAATA